MKQVRKELRGNSHEALFSGLLSLLGINMCHDILIDAVNINRIQTKIC